MSRLTRDGIAEPLSRDQILRRKRGQGKKTFSSSADHEQDWQPYPAGTYSCYMCDHTIAEAAGCAFVNILVKSCDVDIRSVCARFDVFVLNQL